MNIVNKMHRFKVDTYNASIYKHMCVCICVINK